MRRAGVSTLIAGVFMLMMIAAFTISLTLMMEGLTGYLSKQVEVLTEYLTLRNIEVVIEDIDVTTTRMDVIVRNLGGSPALITYYFIRDDSNNVVYGELSELLGVGENRTIRIYGSFNPSAEYVVTLLIQPDLESSVVTKVTQTYPIPAPPQPLPLANYSIIYAPKVIDDYTTLAVGYNSTESPPYPPTGFEVTEGTHHSGDLNSLQAVDGDYLIINSTISGLRVTYIHITEQSGRTLVGYQVNITLDSGWEGWSYVSPDGSDIHFTDDAGNPLYYWIEYFDYGNQEARIWVKVPSIPASSTITIHLLHGGTNPYASYHNPERVFPFFDGFDYTSLSKLQEKWVIVEQTPSLNGTALRISGGNSIEAIRTKATFTPPIAIHFKMAPTRTWGDWDGGIGVGPSIGNILGFTDDRGGNRMNIMWLWWRQADYIGRARSDYVTYHVYQAVMTGADSHFRDLDDGRENNDNYDRSHSGYLWLVNDHDGSGNGNIYDWVFVRNYTSPEPNVLVERYSYATYEAVLTLSWDSAVFSFPTSIASLHLTAELNITSGFTLTVLENSTGTWDAVGSYANTIPTKVPINEVFPSTAGIRLSIHAIQPFSFSVDYSALTEKILDTSRPLIAIAVNGSRSVLVHDLISDSWFEWEVLTTGSFLNPYITFSLGSGRFYLITGTSAYSLDPYDLSVTYLFDVVESVGDSGFIGFVSGYLVYCPGGGSNAAYVYSSDGTLLSTSTLSEPVNPYSAFTVDSTGSRGYVLFGGSGNVSIIEVSGGSLIESKVILKPAPPTAYSTGLTYGNGYLWVISKGGGIHRIDTSSWTSQALIPQPPYYPLSSGDRLAYITLGGETYLYHVRNDGTSEVWVIKVS